MLFLTIWHAGPSHAKRYTSCSIIRAIDRAGAKRFVADLAHEEYGIPADTQIVFDYCGEVDTAVKNNNILTASL